MLLPLNRQGMAEQHVRRKTAGPEQKSSKIIL